MTDITIINVRELLPQQGSFVMVDKLHQCDAVTTVSSLHIQEDNLFLTDSLFIEAGILEHAAQTAAARNGYIDKYVNKGGIRLGFIGEIKNMTIHRLPRAGETLITTLTILNEVLSILLVKIDILSGDELIASGNLKIGMTDIPSAV